MTSLLQSPPPPISPQRAARELLSRRRARLGLEQFTTYTKPDYQVNWHHSALCRKLDQLMAGSIRRLMVFMPPRHGKSELTSRRLPAYALGRDPDMEVIACSYSDDLAGKMNRDVQRIIDSQQYRNLFPETTLYGRNIRSTAQGTWLRNSDLFEVVAYRGAYRSAGVRGGITGMGANLLIIDDPIKNREEADSPTVREAIWEWYTSTFYSRRSMDSRILITMTRWNEDDLAGRLLKLAAENQRADQWEVLRLPAICEDSSNPDDPREPGEALWPDRYPVEELEKTRANSAYEWAALYQQDPRPEGGTEWPPEYFPPSMWFDDYPRDIVLSALALDPSKGRDAKAGDYSAFVSAGLDSRGVLWVDADLERRPATKIVQDGINLFRQRRPSGFAVEINQFQELLAADFRREAAKDNIHLPLYGINNHVSKVVRIRSLGSYFAQQRIRVRNTPGARLLVQQLRDFPHGTNDDGPDALEMAVRLLKHLLGEATEHGSPQLVAA